MSIDTGGYDARKTVLSSKEEQENVFARHKERVSAMKVKTNELSGAQLDWAVAKCEGQEVRFECGLLFLSGRGFTYGDPYNPSTNWEQGGPIIEREGMTVRRYTDTLWDASIGSLDYVKDGPTPLVAAMRCYVSSKLGEEVKVPDELKGE